VFFPDFRGFVLWRFAASALQLARVAVIGSGLFDNPQPLHQTCLGDIG
jgi:hypothetical protein